MSSLASTSKSSTLKVAVSPSTANVPSMSVLSKLDTPSTSMSAANVLLPVTSSVACISTSPKTSNVPSMSVLSKLDTPSTSRSMSMKTLAWKSDRPSTSNEAFKVVAPSTFNVPSKSVVEPVPHAVACVHLMEPVMISPATMSSA